MVKLQAITFLISFLLSISPITTQNKCPKEKPIIKSSTCVLDFCTEVDFKDSTCVIENSIIKTQWLNSIKILGENNFRYLSVSNNKDDNLLLECSYEGKDSQANRRYFYGVDSGGRNIFYDDRTNIDSDTKILKFTSSVYAERHFGEIIEIKALTGKKKSKSCYFKYWYIF